MTDEVAPRFSAENVNIDGANYKNTPVPAHVPVATPAEKQMWTFGAFLHDNWMILGFVIAAVIVVLFYVWYSKSDVPKGGASPPGHTPPNTQQIQQGQPAAQPPNSPQSPQGGQAQTAATPTETPAPSQDATPTPSPAEIVENPATSNNARLAQLQAEVDALEKTRASFDAPKVRQEEEINAMMAPVSDTASA